MAQPILTDPLLPEDLLEGVHAYFYGHDGERLVAANAIWPDGKPYRAVYRVADLMIVGAA